MAAPRPARHLRITARAAAAAALLAAACTGDGAPEVVGPDADAGGREAAAAPALVAHEAIVTFRAPPDAAALASLGGYRVAPVLALGERTYLLRFEELARRAAAAPATRVAIAAIAAAAADLVESAVENHLVPFALVPSDPLYAAHQAWSYDTALRLPLAWDLTTGAPGARIAIIDSGTTAHPDLAWGAGRDVIDNDADPTNPFTYHHGVHVAGIAGARANNGRGGAGVCWSCTIVPIRAAGEIGASVAHLAAAIRWAAGWNDPSPFPGARRAEVINLSLADTTSCDAPENTAVRDAIADAIARGISVVASAGNFAVAGAGFPSNCAGVLAVAASQPGGQLAPYSNRGANVDLTAPGGGYNPFPDWEHFGADVASGAGAQPCPKTGASNPYGDPYVGTAGVVSTWSTWRPASQLATADHCYRHISGTSMAAPHVAGVIGLMRSVNPSLTPAQLARYLTDSARPAAVICPLPGQCGAGMVDAYAAVLAARDGRPELEVTPTALAFAPTRVGTVSAPLVLTVRNTLTGTLTASLPPMAQLQYACAGGTGGASCSCSGTASCQLTAGAGAQAFVHVRYAPTAQGAFAASVQLTSNDPDEPTAAIAVTGTATWSRASVSPDLLHFGFVDVGAQSYPQTVHLANAGSAPLVITAVTTTGASAHYSVTPRFALPATIPPGGGADVDVRCVPTSTGRQAMFLRLVNDANDPGQPVDVRCEATAPQAHVQVAEPGPDFGQRLVGSSTAREIHVNNIGHGTTQLVAFAFTRPAAPFSLTCTSGCACTATTCSGAASAAGPGAVLELRYAPATPGEHAATLVFSSNAPNLPAQSISVAGVGVIGLATLIAPANGMLELANPPHGALGGQVVLRNTGFGPLVIDDLRLGGVDAAAFTLDALKHKLPFELAPGADLTLGVSCALPGLYQSLWTSVMLASNGQNAAPIAQVRCTHRP